MKHVLYSVKLECVPCVWATLKPRYYIVARRQYIHDFSFSLIAPLKAENDVNHDSDYYGAKINTSSPKSMNRFRNRIKQKKKRNNKAGKSGHFEHVQLAGTEFPFRVFERDMKIFGLLRGQLEHGIRQDAFTYAA